MHVSGQYWPFDFISNKKYIREKKHPPPEELSSCDSRASTLTAARDSVRSRDVIVVWRFCDVTMTTDDDGDGDTGDDKQNEADAHWQQDCQRNGVTVTANQSSNTIIVNSLFLSDSR